MFAGITTPILFDGTNATYAEKPFVEPVLLVHASCLGGSGELSDARGENDAAARREPHRGDELLTLEHRESGRVVKPGSRPRALSPHKRDGAAHGIRAIGIERMRLKRRSIRKRHGAGSRDRRGIMANGKLANKYAGDENDRRRAAGETRKAKRIG
nr:hypothetical protein [Burkholderia pseudomallei]